MFELINDWEGQVHQRIGSMTSVDASPSKETGLTILRNRDLREKTLKHSSGKEEFRENMTFGEGRGGTQRNGNGWVIIIPGIVIRNFTAHIFKPPSGTFYNLTSCSQRNTNCLERPNILKFITSDDRNTPFILKCSMQRFHESSSKTVTILFSRKERAVFEIIAKPTNK
uniref:Uncharacterized protein n=1 Tax=Romanomermis culicivorax TaxID=13658 RepID=A0A915JN35_ROMCU